MAEVKIAADSGGGSISIKGPSSSGSNVDVLDTSGNLRVTGKAGFGTTDTSGYNTAADDLTIATAGDTGITINSGTTSNGTLAFTDGQNTTWQGAIDYDHNTNLMQLVVNNENALQIDQNHNVTIKAVEGTSRYFFGGVGDAEHAELSMYDSAGTQGIRIGVDAETFFNVGTNMYFTCQNASGTNGRVYLNRATGSNTTLEVNQNTGGGTEMITFRCEGTQIGSITQNGASNTSFNTGSDYRLKENISLISDGITRVKQLKPSRFNWIADDTNTPQDGFIAHEVSSVIPEAVQGEKDAVFAEDTGIGNDKKGAIKVQKLDYSKFTPLLTAALQEAIAKIETLETKVAALEAG